MKKSILFLMAFLITACSPSADGYNHRANQAYHGENYQSALKGYQQAQVQSPDDMTYYFNGALAYAGMGQYNQALSALAIARLKMDVNNPNADLYYNEGNIYAQIGDYQDAISAYQAGLRINPDHADMRYNLEAVLLLAVNDPTTSSNPPTPPQTPPDGLGGETPTESNLTLEQALAILEQIERNQDAWGHFNLTPDEGVYRDGDAW